MRTGGIHNYGFILNGGDGLYITNLSYIRQFMSYYRN